MSDDRRGLLERIFLLAPTDDWYVGIYEDGTDPVADDLAGEIARTIFTPYIVLDLGIYYISNAGDVDLGPLAAVDVGGVFVANGETNSDVSWVLPLTTPVTVSSGEIYRINGSSLRLGV